MWNAKAILSRAYDVICGFQVVEVHSGYRGDDLELCCVAAL
jgi:hypothetical protein